MIIIAIDNFHLNERVSATVIIIFVVVQPRHLQFVVALNVLFIAQATGDLPSSGLSPSSSLFLGQVGGGQYCLLSICLVCSGLVGQILHQNKRSQ